MRLLDTPFYGHHPKGVAKQLIGKTILRRDDSEPIKAIIIDTEAYGPLNEDEAARAKGWQALRNWELGLAWTTYYMWGKPTFDIIVRGPGAVLVRGILLGLADTKRRIIRGPVNVATALHIDKFLDKTDLTQISPISIHQNVNVIVHNIQSSRRINLRLDSRESRRFFIRVQDLEIK
jgi:3-methyladenine DNA glycosylase Mpg